MVKKVSTFLLFTTALSFAGCSPSPSPQPPKVVLKSIEITDLPTKVEYYEGEQLLLDGLKVVANYTNDTSKEVTNYTVDVSGALTPDINKVTVSYTEESVTKSTFFPINVKTIASKYDFDQKFPSEVPSIHFKTADTTWATKYTRNDKLAHRIEYVPATISTTGGSKDKYNFSDVAANVKVRGNYTLDYVKKPIRIKFDKKQTMFGLNDEFKAKSWVLLADWKDLSMLNNTTSFYLGNRILGSDGLYNTDYMNVKVYINDQYWGLYLLAEQQEVKDGRIDVTEAEDDSTLDLGYLFEFDGYYNLEDPTKGDDYTFTIDYGNFPLKTASGASISYSEINKGYTIKSDTYSDAQRNQIKVFLNNVFKIAWYAMHENKFYKLSDDYTTLVETSETDPYKVISKYINVESWVDNYILSELACDPDLGWSSMYMDCDLNHERFKPLTFEALWDFDSAFGIRKIARSHKGYFALNKNNGHANPWFVILNGCEWFMNLVKAKWLEITKVGVFNDALENILAHKTKYESFYEENFVRWPTRITQGNDEVVPEVDKNHTEGDGADYLYNWLSNRVKELHRLFTGEEIVDPEVQEAIDFAKSAIKHRYEAEDGNLFGSCTVKTGYNSSNGKYVGSFSGSPSNYITFNVSSPIEQDAVIYMGCSKRASEGNLNYWMNLYVNNVAKSLFNCTVPPCESGLEWHDFGAFIACKIHLNAGNNAVKLTATADATNMDFFDFYAKTGITFSK